MMYPKKPPMGFNTWNTFAGEINEELILRTADKMVELGLRDAGYEYLVIDDCWSEMERDPETDRLVPDHIKFPHGMKACADAIHAKGYGMGRGLPQIRLRQQAGRHPRRRALPPHGAGAAAIRTRYRVFRLPVGLRRTAQMDTFRRCGSIPFHR